MNPPSTTTHLKATEELVVTIVPIQSLEVSVIAELDEVNKAAQETPQSPYDTESEIKSMPDDDLRFVSGFEAVDSDDTNDNEVSHSAYTSHGIASAERLSIPDHLDHICEEVSYLHSRLRTMKSFIVQIVSNEIKSSLPTMITNALKEQVPGILSAVSE
ncbi:hypothetical protein Tco_1232422 [Tanacetum coccineum]